MLTVNRSEGSPIGEVWQILPNSQEANEQTFNDQIITTDETSNDGIQQIIYVSYQDPDDPNQSRTLHLGMQIIILMNMSILYTINYTPINIY